MFLLYRPPPRRRGSLPRISASNYETPNTKPSDLRSIMYVAQEFTLANRLSLDSLIPWW